MEIVLVLIIGRSKIIDTCKLAKTVHLKQDFLRFSIKQNDHRTCCFFLTCGPKDFMIPSCFNQNGQLPPSPP